MTSKQTSYGIGFSPLSKQIFVSKIRPVKGKAPGAMKFVGEQTILTNEAIYAVAQYIDRQGNKRLAKSVLRYLEASEESE